MPETINGSMTLAQQESAIQFKEAKGYKLNSFKADPKNPPTNNAEFDKLPIGGLPDLFQLVLGSVPEGETQIWSGKIYVEAELKQAAAYRVPE